MMKQILPILQFLFIALQHKNLFVDAKRRNILRGSQAENQSLGGFLRELTDASTNQNRRLLKEDKRKQSNESVTEKADKKDPNPKNEKGPNDGEEPKKKPPTKNTRQDVLEVQKTKPPKNTNSKDDDLDKDGKDDTPPASPPTETPIAPTSSPVAPPTDIPIAPTLSPVSPPTETPIAPTSSPVAPPTDIPIAPTLSPVSPPTETPIAPTSSPVAPPTDIPIAPTLSPVSPPTETPIAPTSSPVTPPIETPITPTLSPVSPPTETPIAPTLTPISPSTETPIAPIADPVSPSIETPVSATLSPVSPPIEILILPSMSPELHSTDRPVVSFTLAPSSEGSSDLIPIPSLGPAPEPVPIPSSSSASASTTAPSSSTSSMTDVENIVPPTESRLEEVNDKNSSSSPDDTGKPESVQASEFQFDKNKYVDGEKLQTITFSMTVSKFSQISNEEKLEIYFKEFVEDVLEMRSNRDWYPFHSKSVHNITMELLPNFVVEQNMKERNANSVVPVELAVNGIVLVNSNEQDRQQRTHINDSEPSVFQDSFDHSMLLYFTFWGVDSLQNILEEVGGLQDLAIHSVSVGEKELIAVDKDGNHLIKGVPSSSDQIVGAVSNVENKSSVSASKCGLMTYIMVSASIMWYF